MAAAAILTGASLANTTGGTFADTLVANSGDSLTIPTTPDGYGTLVAAWAIDSDSVAEFEMYTTRPQSFVDTTTGFRWAVPAIALGGAATNAAFTAFKKYFNVPLYSGDTVTIKASTTAADDVAACLLTLYNNLPGVDNPQFTTIDQVMSLRTGNFGIYQNPTASGTPGAWGAARALTADDNRFQANTYYAILGCTVKTQVTAISLVSTLWGGQRIGLPAGSLDLNNSEWFAEISAAYNQPLIPYFSQADAANINVYVMDAEASTAPKIDWNIVQLSGKPG